MDKSAPPPPYQTGQPEGYPQQPPPGQGYAPVSQFYPPEDQGYPPVGLGYPPAGQGYPVGAPPPGYAPVPGYIGTQPQGYPPAATTKTVVIQQGAVVLGEAPYRMECPHCHNQIVTRVSYEAGTLAWVLCLVLVLVGCGLGCCLIPFCIDGAKDAHHTCPHCHQFLGAHRRM